MATYWISYDNTEDKRRRRETRRRWRWPCPVNTRARRNRMPPWFAQHPLRTAARSRTLIITRRMDVRKRPIPAHFGALTGA